MRLAAIRGETPKGVLSAPLILPAVLKGFSWTEEASHSEYDTVRGGQFSQPALGPPTARRLRSLDDMETLTIDWDAPWLVEQGQDPDDVYNSMYAVLRSRSPVELLATPKFGPQRPLLRMNITIRSIVAEMREGEPDTTYYTLRIAEWRRATAGRAGSDSRGSKLPTTHKLTEGDTLYGLSQKYYSSAAGAEDIARANAIKRWGKTTPLVQMQRFKVGSKIKIPKVSAGTLRGERVRENGVLSSSDIASLIAAQRK